MRIRKISTSLLTILLICGVILSCFAFTASAAEVTRSQNNYTVSAKDINGGIYVSNKNSVNTAVGTEYYMTYTVKSVKRETTSTHQQGIIGTNVPGVAFPYTTPEADKGGLMYFDRNEDLLVEGKTYFIKYTITADGYDYVIGWAKDSDSRYITFTDKAGKVTSDLGYFGVWFDFSFDYFELELIKVRCYDRYGNDLGVQTNRPQAFVYVDEPLQKDTKVDHSYDVKVEDKVLMFIGNKYIPTSDTMYIEYTVKPDVKTKVEQAGVILTDAPYLGFPYLNGYMLYNQYSRNVDDMSAGPLMEGGASYLIRFERKADRLDVTAQKTINGKTVLVDFKAEYGDYIKEQNYFGIWLCGVNEYPNNFELVDFKCYDSNKKNLGVWCNLGAKITHYGALENYEELDGIFYNEEDATFIELYQDATVDLVAADGSRQKGTWTISDAFVMTVTVGEREQVYDYLYTHIKDAEGNVWNRLTEYKVTFDTGKGSAIPAQTVGIEQGYRVAKPEDPTQEGNTFVCWTASDGKEFDFDSIITGSVTLYAKWQNAEYPKVAWENNEQTEFTVIIAGAVVLLAGVITACVLILRGKKYAKTK